MNDADLNREIKEAMEKFCLERDDAEVVVYSRRGVVAPFKLLSQYDDGRVSTPSEASLEDSENIAFANEQEWDKSGRKFYKLTSENALNLAKFVTEKFPENHGFGIERESGALAGIIGNLYQTACGQEVYPTPMAKAANLLYSVIKNHPFVNGNKRIAVFLFCVFLDLHDPDIIGKKIGYAAMPAIALLIATSNPNDRKLMVDFVMRLFE